MKNNQKTKSSDERGLREGSRMEFFWVFLRSRGMSMNGAASAIGYTQPATVRWMLSDDLRVDVMRTLADASGCRMDVSLVRPESSEDGTQTQEPVYVTDLLKSTGNGNVESRSLEFVHLAMKRYGIRPKDWSVRGMIPQTNVHHWLKGDRMMWSRVCQFAHLFGLEVHVRFSLKEPAPVRQDGVVIHVDYDCSGRYVVPAELPDKSR